MKKWRADDFWFELTEGSSPDGVGFVRYNEVTCRKCGAKAKHLASGQSADQLRKFFIRQNWEIGRSRFHHVCPECAHKHKLHRLAEEIRTWEREHRPEPEAHHAPPKPSNVVPLHPPQRVSLQDAWKQADENERAEFLLKLRDVNGPIFTDPREEFKPEPVADDHMITEDDGEVADWWLELQKEQDHG